MKKSCGNPKNEAPGRNESFADRMVVLLGMLEDGLREMALDHDLRRAVLEGFEPTFRNVERLVAEEPERYERKGRGKILATLRRLRGRTKKMEPQTRPRSTA